MSTDKAMHEMLADLRSEHRDLDEVIGQLIADPAHDDLQVRRLKKRKLALKDEITRLENILLPDIIA